MHTERLTELARFLLTVPKDKFDLDAWRNNTAASDIEDSSDVDDNALLHTCGTTGCAVGWACSHAPFKAQGLRYDTEMQTIYYSPPGSDTATVRWLAVMEFFEITEPEALWLFNDIFYDHPNPTTDDVIARIERLLAGGPPTPTPTHTPTSVDMTVITGSTT